MKRLLLLAMLCGFAAGCDRGPPAPLIVSDLDIRMPRPGTQMGAAYLTLTSNLDRPLVITRVTSPQFGAVEIHETVHEGDVARMRAVPRLEIEAGARVQLVPGGRHLMLMRPAGETREVSFSFWADDALLVSVTAETDGG